MTVPEILPTPEQRRHDDLVRSEHTMLWVRALGVVFGGVQVLTYGALPYPPGHLALAVGLMVALAVVDLVALLVLRVSPPRTLRQARAMALVTVALDTFVASGLVFAYSFDPASAHWAILFVLPLLGAARFRLAGALWTWGGITVLYTLRQAYAAATFDDIGFSPSSIVFRMGLVAMVALVAGLMARDLARERERTAAALGEVARIDHLRARLVDSLAHDMRSPLVAVSGALQALDPSQPLEVQQQLVGLARRQAQRLTRLATGMLDLARLDRGHLDLQVRPTVLAEVVADVVAALDPKDGEVVVDVPEDLVLAVDPDRLDQVLFNLIGNGLRHGRPPVEVGASQAGSATHLTVCDHGSGVPEERREALFDAFTTSASGGVGLGLWLVRALVEAHGGDVSYRTGEDGGATFDLRLPTGGARRPEPAPPGRHGAPGAR